MPVGVIVQFKGAKTAQYDAVMKEMGLGKDAKDWPKALVAHVAGQSDEGLCVVDIWDRREDFDAFLGSRLKSAIDKVGGLPRPQVTFFPVHNGYRRQ